ncbi:unnamed protein product [Arabidopsis lyrata]|uniref:F-box associated beta-propeller type 3 domain-containing protein n=1 Tax=Arabidopsis lyrata subsp. lyrata TaxID=81972 RepID=D7LU76_ARALL|nr:hypothetical protein ARALYDRAFT_906621 [Arabidopsis lyrata subsp. lyrata]CAH8268380.1 unnamed protein product [Arabidopsis lyrata]
MGCSFRLAAVKGLMKKEIRSTADEFERPRKRRRVMVKPDSKPCGLENLTEDLLMDILAKEVTRSMCVSQFWADQREYVLVSSSSSPPDHSDVSVLDQDLNMPGMGGYFVNALRGLLCVRLGRRVRICNLTTKQRVTLPIIRSSLLAEANDNVWSYFGHDSVNDEYKVLSTVWEESKREGIVRSEHQILVLGPGAYWRNTYSTIPPPPYSQGISIDGVLYYGAWVDKNRCVLMSFDLSSEEFNLIELPVEAGIIWHTTRANLINYRGKLTVFEYSRFASDASVDLWVMENAGKKKWSNKTVVLPLSQMNFAPSDKLGMQGTSRCNEVRLAMIKRIPTTEPRRSVI